MDMELLETSVGNTAETAEVEPAAAADAAAAAADSSVMDGNAIGIELSSDEVVSHHLSQEQLQPLYISMQVQQQQQQQQQQQPATKTNSLIPSTGFPPRHQEGGALQLALQHKNGSYPHRCSPVPSVRALPQRPMSAGMRSVP